MVVVRCRCVSVLESPPERRLRTCPAAGRQRRTRRCRHRRRAVASPPWTSTEPPAGAASPPPTFCGLKGSLVSKPSRSLRISLDFLPSVLTAGWKADERAAGGPPPGPPGRTRERAARRQGSRAARGSRSGRPASTAATGHRRFSTRSSMVGAEKGVHGVHGLVTAAVGGAGAADPAAAGLRRRGAGRALRGRAREQALVGGKHVGGREDGDVAPLHREALDRDQPARDRELLVAALDEAG